MSTNQTPRQRGIARGAPNASSPNLRASITVNSRASLRAQIGNTPTTPVSKMSETDFAVGDVVNVPGDMYGIVKFIGNVRGKQGHFAGVELSKEFAAKGKNDGDVDG